MYKPAKPIRCPSCGEIVQVDTSMILTSNPPQYKWECPKCGRTGTTSSKDIIAFENQKPMRTSGYIQKIDEADHGVGVTTTNADDIITIDITPATYSTNTKCTICGEEFGFDGEHRICPKCREAIIRLRNPKSTTCDIPVKPILQQGWECPKCGAILAPHQKYCPFCSPSEYGRTNWLWTNTPTSGQYTNPNPITTVSSGDILKVADSCTHTSATPCNNLKATL